MLALMTLLLVVPASLAAPDHRGLLLDLAAGMAECKVTCVRSHHLWFLWVSHYCSKLLRSSYKKCFHYIVT